MFNIPLINRYSIILFFILSILQKLSNVFHCQNPGFEKFIQKRFCFLKMFYEYPYDNFCHSSSLIFTKNLNLTFYYQNLSYVLTKNFSFNHKYKKINSFILPKK